MTTAHRPTFEPARGGTGKNEGDLSKLSQQYSSKDMPSHTKLKYRQKGQSHPDELRSKDFRRELEEKERNAARERRSKDSGWSSQKKPRLEASIHNVQDDDDPYDDLNDNSGSEEDDTAELMAELARIKKERAMEKAQRDAALAEEQVEPFTVPFHFIILKISLLPERIRTENILHGNPLLSSDTAASGFKRYFGNVLYSDRADLSVPNGRSVVLGSALAAFSIMQVKRRWDDDVVFKNCAKGIEERSKEQIFINDAIRSEFHKKFMEKYIK
ncbi:unnamed protein product [Gongylonema pulchrum]|uniref:Spliceosome-associated protein CWC15 homolog n=1 Tax=Gongylonema pulchrum TaxID=637853 RepID=A0A183DNE0_9BILA|nr:unnamed protein product [Gongylonema pulchrum]